MRIALVYSALIALPGWAQPIREAFSPALIEHRMPCFYNGYLFSVAPQHVVTLFAPDGQLVLTLPIQGRGNSNVGVKSLAVDEDGTLAVGWSDAPNAGIDIRDSFGNLIRTIDTGRYIPAHLSFASDHSLWSLGAQQDATKPNFPDRQDYAIVRKYSPEGKEVGAYLPRSSFPPGLEPGMVGWQTRQITITNDRVGLEVYSGKFGGQKEWVELDLTGRPLGRWRLDTADQFPGVALTADNQAYVHRWDRESKSTRTFRLDRVASAWIEVSAPQGELYGADGDNLVFAKWHGVTMDMMWYPQPAAAVHDAALIAK
jgi:hypothetical protein